MRFMNEWDIEDALRRFRPDETPNLATGAEVLAALAGWTNRNSDGWAYWPKPVRAANALIVLLEAQRGKRWGNPVEDVTAAQLKKALAPIKAFLTRQGVAYDVVGIR